MPRPLVGALNLMKTIKIQGIEINIEGAKQMKKTDFIKAYNSLGKDGALMWDELQAIIKPKKSEE